MSDVSSDRRSPVGHQYEFKRKKSHKDVMGDISRRRKEEKRPKKEKKRRRRHDSDSEEDVKRTRHDSISDDESSVVRIKVGNHHGDGSAASTANEVIEILQSQSTSSAPDIASTQHNNNKISRVDFFNKLLLEERKKGPVGTAHATGRRGDAAGTAGGNPGDWTCPKCSTSNFKNSNQCQKCHALKRMSQFR